MRKVYVIIPCYNEEAGLASLEIAIHAFLAEHGARYHFSWIFVDDGSLDRTGPLLAGMANRVPSASVEQHPHNLGLGAALATGIRALPPCDYVAYLDSDCTYHPDTLIPLLAELDQGADVSVASPYHPAGKVLAVPAWRLFLSRGLSFLYRLATGRKLYTFTAMVKAQTFASAKKSLNTQAGFPFVIVALLKSIQNGERVTEVPATLSLRVYGQSKMRVLRTIGRHLAILARIFLGGKA